MFTSYLINNNMLIVKCWNTIMQIQEFVCMRGFQMEYCHRSRGKDTFILCGVGSFTETLDGVLCDARKVGLVILSLIQGLESLAVSWSVNWNIWKFRFIWGCQFVQVNQFFPRTLIGYLLWIKTVTLQGFYKCRPSFTSWCFERV